jgi:hypothetical protein
MIGLTTTGFGEMMKHYESTFRNRRTWYPNYDRHIELLGPAMLYFALF